MFKTEGNGWLKEFMRKDNTRFLGERGDWGML